jgi:hypothetical protein
LRHQRPSGTDRQRKTEDAAMWAGGRGGKISGALPTLDRVVSRLLFPQNNKNSSKRPKSAELSIMP